MTNNRELFIEISNQQVTECDEVVGYLVKNSRMNELEKALSVPAQHVIPDEITSASAPEVFEIAAEAGRLGIRGTYGVYAVGWNACRAEMLKAQQNEPQNIPENIPTAHSAYISFDALMAAVSEVTGAKSEFDATPEKCYQAVPFMNFNSLSRIVEMFRTSQPAIQLAPHVYRELVNDLRDVALEYHDAQQLRERISGALSKAVTAVHPHLAQPVSEPYKLNGWISVDNELPEEGARVLVFSDGAFVLLAEFTGGEFYDVVRDGEEFFETVTRCVTHWMPLPAAPAQEQK